jgi:predicted nucleotidyltransferase
MEPVIITAVADLAFKIVQLWMLNSQVKDIPQEEIANKVKEILASLWRPFPLWEERVW